MMTINSRHIQQKYHIVKHMVKQGWFTALWQSGPVNPADIGTKPLSVHLHRRLKYWLMGAQFYPAPSTEHFQLLEMQFYEINYVVIIRQYKGK